jgi:hypothetical protein
MTMLSTWRIRTLRSKRRAPLFAQRADAAYDFPRQLSSTGCVARSTRIECSAPFEPDIPSMRTTALLLFLTAAAAAQSASFTPYGTGCTMNGQQLVIGNQGLPQLGQTFQVTYSGPNFTFSSAQQTSWPNLVLGLGQQAVPLPPGIFGLFQQPAGCMALVTPDLLIPTQPDPNGRPQYENFIAIAVPNSPPLIGATLQAQWVALFEQCGFAGCNLAALPTSDAATITVGT